MLQQTSKYLKDKMWKYQKVEKENLEILEDLVLWFKRDSVQNLKEYILIKFYELSLFTDLTSS